MATAVTSSKIVAYDTFAAVTSIAATANTDGGEEEFTITPAKGCQSGVIIVGGTGSAADGDITYSIAAGDLWAGKALSGTITQNTTVMIQVETARVMQDDGTISLTLDPAATDKLLTDHAASVKFIELR